MRNKMRKIIVILISVCLSITYLENAALETVYADENQVVYYGLNEEFKYDQYLLDGKLKISSPYLYVKKGQTVMLATITNISQQKIEEFTLVNVYFYDKSGVIIVVLSGIISPLNPWQSTQFNMSATLTSYASKVFSYTMEVKETGERSTLQKTGETIVSSNVTNASLVNSIEGKISMTLQDVKFADGTLKGPSLDIMNGKYTFTPLNMEFNAGLPLSSLKHQAIIDTNKRTVYVMLGVSKNGKSSIEQTNDMTDWTWSKQYNELKTFYKNITGFEAGKSNWKGESNWNSFQKLKGELDRMGCDMFIHADMSIAGYMEFDYSEGQIKFREGGIVEEVNAGTSFKFPIYANLVYTSIGLSVKEKGSIVLEQKNSVVVPTCTLALSTTATASIVGRLPLDLAKAEGGINATLMGTLSTNDPKFTMNMSGDVFVKVSLLSGTAELFNHSWKYVDATIYPEFKNNLQNSATRCLSANCMDDLLEGAVSTDRVGQITNYQVKQNNEFEKSVYTDNAARLIKLDNGREMLIWIDDNGEKSEKNRTSLMYSIFDRNGWSEPQVIYEDGSFFGEFDIDQDDNGNVYVVFQKGTEIFEESLSYSEIVRKIDPFLVTFDGENFSAPIQLVGDNSNYEADVKICASDEGATVTWIEYSDEYLAGESELLSVCRVLYDRVQNNCYEKEKIRNTSNLLFYVAETQDATYVIEKENEEEMYLLNCIKNGNCEEIDSFEQITSLEIEDGVVYYLNNGELYWTDGLRCKSTGLVCPDNFQICSSNSDTHVIFDYYDSQKTTIYDTKIDGETVGETLVYGVYDNYVKNYSACIDDENELQMAVGICDFDIREDGFNYINMILKTTKKKELVSLKAVAAFYEDEDIVPGEKLPLTFQVTNEGNSSSGKFSVILLDEMGNKLKEQEYNTSILPGATEEFVLDFQLDKDLKRQTMKVKLVSEEDIDIEDNDVDFEIGLADLNLDNLVLAECVDKVKLSGKVVNLGYEKCGNVQVKLVETTSTENIDLKTITLNDVDSLAEKDFEILFSHEDITLEEDEDIKDVTFTIEVTSENEEADFSNNFARVYEENKKFSEDYYIEGVNAHIEVIDEAKEPTCINTGLTEGSHCEVCGKILKEQEEVGTKEHDFFNQPYQTDDVGKHYQRCRNCSAESAHVACTPDIAVVEDIVVSTCCQNGSHNEVVYCSICNQRISTIQVIDPTNGEHNYTKYVSNGDGTHRIVCKDCGAIQEGHSADLCSGGNATCKEKAKCSICKGEYGNLVAHKYTNYISDNNATCETDGTKTARCDYGCGHTDTVVNVNSKRGHSFGTPTFVSSDDGTSCNVIFSCTRSGCAHTENYAATVTSVVKIPATCCAKGVTQYTYTYLNYTNSRDVANIEINPNNHAGELVVKNKKTSTYFEKGYSGDLVCGSCGKVTKKGKTTAIKKLSKVTLSSVKSSTGKKIIVKWKKIKDATGYEIQYSTDRKFKKSVKKVKIKKASILSATLKNLSENKKYYVRIRAYKRGKINKKSKTVYSSWSSIKNVKTKK